MPGLGSTGVLFLLDCAFCVYHEGSGSHVQLCPRPCCVIAEGLGCPRKLAHAAGSGHFFWRLHTKAHLSSFGLFINRKHKNTNCNNFTSGNHVRGARFNAYFELSWAISARQCTTETEFSKLATITPQMRMLLAPACETRVLRPVARPSQACYKVHGAERARCSRTVVQTNKWHIVRGTNLLHAYSADARPRTFSSTIFVEKRDV